MTQKQERIGWIKLPYGDNDDHHGAWFTSHIPSVITTGHYLALMPLPGDPPPPRETGLRQ